MTRPAVRHAVISAVLYLMATAVLGRELLANLATRIMHDEVDPLLIAGILRWNASHIPFTDAWWQFPIFYPAADVLAFSEHLLGVSVIAAPLDWLTGSSIVAANLTSLATFPLCALAAFALARHLTGSSLAAFVAGLVYGFGPYRMGQLAHVQMLAAQWAPIAILALHLYLETRATRWLALFGAAWLLQAMSNGYALFFLSVFVGLWMLWFVVLRRQWQTAVSIALTMAVASVPLAPILSKYVAVHARNGFTRGPLEVRAFSADAMGFLCAPFEVSAWGWMRHACVPEGELFPGLVTGLLFVAGFLVLRRSQPRRLERPALAGGAAGAGRRFCRRAAGVRGGRRRRRPVEPRVRTDFRTCRLRGAAVHVRHGGAGVRLLVARGFAARCGPRRRSRSTSRSRW